MLNKQILDKEALDKVVARLLERVKEQTAKSGNPIEKRFSAKNEWKEIKK